MSTDDTAATVTSATEENSVSTRADTSVADITYNEVEELPDELLDIFADILARILEEEQEASSESSDLPQGEQRDAAGGIQS